MVDNVREWVLEEPYPYFGAICQATISTLKIARPFTHMIQFSTAGSYHQQDQVIYITPELTNDSQRERP